jgi:predicted O-methyltransferase YrrM
MNFFEKLAKNNFEIVINKYFKNEQVYYLEIGSYIGHSLKYVFENCDVIEACVIDLFEDFNGASNQLQQFSHNLKDYLSKIKIYRDYSEVALKKLQINYYNFIYIDGDHSSKAVFIDAVLSFTLLKINGIMIFDDYLWIHNEDHIPNENNPELFNLNNPYCGINQFLKLYQNKIEIIYKNWQVVIKKIKD